METNKLLTLRCSSDYVFEKNKIEKSALVKSAEIPQHFIFGFSNKFISIVSGGSAHI
jgi:hypothetical protein